MSRRRSRRSPPTRPTGPGAGCAARASWRTPGRGRPRRARPGGPTDARDRGRSPGRRRARNRPSPRGRRRGRSTRGRSTSWVPGMMTLRIRASARRLSSAATRSTDRRGWTLESNRSPAIRKRSTFSARARSIAALNAANWRSRWAAACSPRSSCRAPRWTSAVWMILSIAVEQASLAVTIEMAGSQPRRRVSPGEGPWSAIPRRWCERGAPMTPRSPTPMIVRHCDRYVVTVASPPVEHGSVSPAGFREPLYPAGH